MWYLATTMHQLVALFMFFSIFKASALLAQECEPSSDNCYFYSCVENTVRCGAKGYPLRFGKRKCEMYLQAEPNASPEVQDWYRKARVCLQEALGDIVGESLGSMDCHQLKKDAFESHTKCYLESGFCELSPKGQFQILRTGGFSLLLPPSLRTGIEIAKACRQPLVMWSE